ncbi:MAG: hypothetical protein R3F07_12880 [Opitutaceae bacterium]
MNIELDMLRQPSDSSCGPTCLHAIYRFFGQDHDLHALIDEIHQFEEGGTISVHLAIDALDRGFQTTLYTYNLRIFDPTWWNLTRAEFLTRLKERTRHLELPKDIEAHQAYVDYLQRGGILRLADLSPYLLEHLVSRREPILVGLSSTYLYQSIRETPDCKDNDIAGWPVGHFVVMTGYHADTEEVVVTDPFGKNPFNPHGVYRVDVHRFINAVLLGIMTYDANLLIISNTAHQP